MSLKVRTHVPCEVWMERRIEVWRPLKKFLKDENTTLSLRSKIRLFPDRSFLGRLLHRKIAKVLVDVDVKTFELNDLVVDAGLDALCGQAFDSSANRPAVFNYVAIGTDSTSPSSSDTALGAEYMRVQGTYSKDANTGECSMDATFDIDATKALNECGLFNASSGGTMYCRDTYTTKNVESGDTVKVYYTPKFQRPS